MAETVGIDRGEIPDLTRAPASLLEALEAHVAQAEGRQYQPGSTFQQVQVCFRLLKESLLFQLQYQAAQQTVNQFSVQGGFQGQQATAAAALNEAEKQRLVKQEEEVLRQYEEQRRRAGGAGPSGLLVFLEILFFIHFF